MGNNSSNSGAAKNNDFNNPNYVLPKCAKVEVPPNNKLEHTSKLLALHIAKLLQLPKGSISNEMEQESDNFNEFYERVVNFQYNGNFVSPVTLHFEVLKLMGNNNNSDNKGSDAESLNLYFKFSCKKFEAFVPTFKSFSTTATFSGEACFYISSEPWSTGAPSGIVATTHAAKPPAAVFKTFNCTMYASAQCPFYSFQGHGIGTQQQQNNQTLQHVPAALVNFAMNMYHGNLNKGNSNNDNEIKGSSNSTAKLTQLKQEKEANSNSYMLSSWELILAPVVSSATTFQEEQSDCKDRYHVLNSQVLVYKLAVQVDKLVLENCAVKFPLNLSFLTRNDTLVLPNFSTITFQSYNSNNTNTITINESNKLQETKNNDSTGEILKHQLLLELVKQTCDQEEVKKINTVLQQIILVDNKNKYNNNEESAIVKKQRYNSTIQISTSSNLVIETTRTSKDKHNTNKKVAEHRQFIQEEREQENEINQTQKEYCKVQLVLKLVPSPSVAAAMINIWLLSATFYGASLNTSKSLLVCLKSIQNEEEEPLLLSNSSIMVKTKNKLLDQQLNNNSNSFSNSNNQSNKQVTICNDFIYNHEMISHEDTQDCIYDVLEYKSTYNSTTSTIQYNLERVECCNFIRKLSKSKQNNHSYNQLAQIFNMDMSLFHNNIYNSDDTTLSLYDQYLALDSIKAKKLIIPAHSELIRMQYCIVNKFFDSSYYSMNISSSISKLTRIMWSNVKTNYRYYCLNSKTYVRDEKELTRSQYKEIPPVPIVGGEEEAKLLLSEPNSNELLSTNNSKILYTNRAMTLGEWVRLAQLELKDNYSQPQHAAAIKLQLDVPMSGYAYLNWQQCELKVYFPNKNAILYVNYPMGIFEFCSALGKSYRSQIIDRTQVLLSFVRCSVSLFSTDKSNKMYWDSFFKIGALVSIECNN